MDEKGNARTIVPVSRLQSHVETNVDDLLSFRF